MMESVLETHSTETTLSTHILPLIIPINPSIRICGLFHQHHAWMGSSGTYIISLSYRLSRGLVH